MTAMRGTHRDHESNLDALLEDLQTTVSRSNSTVGLNGQVTGYRSIRRTVTDGTPEGTQSEYQVEYMNPSNSTTQVMESSWNGSSSAHKSDNNRFRAITPGDVKMKQNISELDSLLDDLNAAQRKNFSSSVVSTSHTNSGIDPGLLEPSSDGKMIQKMYREEKTTTSLRGRSPSPRGRELVFTGRSRDASPVPVVPPVPLDYHTSFEQREQTPTVQQLYRYEKTTSTRTTAPTVTHYGGDYPPYSVDESPLATPLAIRDRSPSPINSNSRHQSSSYNYSTSRDTTHASHHDRVPHIEPDTTPKYGSTKAYSYSSSSTRETRTEGQNPPPPPHRSPSPVSFAQPPLPGTKNARGYADHSPPPVRRSQSPKFAPSEPNKLTYNVSPPHVSRTYNYSSSTTTSSNAYNDDVHNNLKPRPFPVSPGEQQPPKRLDDLMATITDGNVTPDCQYPPPQQHDRYSETNVNRYTSHHTTTHHHTNGGPHYPIGNGHPPGTPEPHVTKTVTLRASEKEKESEAEREKLLEREREDSKGVSGPPVYYPPGELFAKKEESMMMKQEGGSKYKAMAKYEYEAKSKSKHTETSGKAVVPVCLPVCCAMPCSIM